MPPRADPIPDQLPSPDSLFCSAEVTDMEIDWTTEEDHAVILGSPVTISPNSALSNTNSLASPIPAPRSPGMPQGSLIRLHHDTEQDSFAGASCVNGDLDTAATSPAVHVYDGHGDRTAPEAYDIGSSERTEAMEGLAFDQQREDTTDEMDWDLLLTPSLPPPMRDAERTSQDRSETSPALGMTPAEQAGAGLQIVFPEGPMEVEQSALASSEASDGGAGVAHTSHEAFNQPVIESFPPSQCSKSFK